MQCSSVSIGGFPHRLIFIDALLFCIDKVFIDKPAIVPTGYYFDLLITNMPTLLKLVFVRFFMARIVI